MSKVRSGPITEIFGQRLKSRMDDLNLSTAQLAEILDVDRSTVAKWLSGSQAPSVEILPKVSAALDCTLDYLYGLSDHPEYKVINADQLPAQLREKKVDAVEVLRSQVTEDGGLTQAAVNETLRIIASAKILKKGKYHLSKPDLQPSQDSPQE